MGVLALHISFCYPCRTLGNFIIHFSAINFDVLTSVLIFLIEDYFDSSHVFSKRKWKERKGWDTSLYSEVEKTLQRTTLTDRVDEEEEDNTRVPIQDLYIYI